MQYRFLKRTRLFLMEPLSGINRTIHEIRKKDKRYPGKRSFNFSGSPEMLNYTLNARRGFHLRRGGFPDAITLEQVIRHHREAQGRYGGQHCPLLHRTSTLFFRSWQKEFSRAIFYIPMSITHQYRLTCNHCRVLSGINGYFWGFR